VTFMDTLTSLLAGITIFAILGNLAEELNVPISEVINSGGTGLAFISYPDAIAKFETVPWLFAILFFFMLLVLSVGSLVALQNSVNTAITDAFPNLKDWWVCAGTSIAGFLIGLVYVTPGGQFILNLVDFFGGTFVIYVAAILEITGVVWWYGLHKIAIDSLYMLDRKLNPYWRIMWGVITPVMLIVIFIYFVVTIERLTYGDYEYPDSAIICGWMILLVAVVQIICWIIYYIYKNRELGWPGMVTAAFRAQDYWGPKNPKRFEEYNKFKVEKKDDVNEKYPKKGRRIVYHLIGR